MQEKQKFCYATSATKNTTQYQAKQNYAYTPETNYAPHFIRGRTQNQTIVSHSNFKKCYKCRNEGHIANRSPQINLKI